MQQKGCYIQSPFYTKLIPQRCEMAALHIYHRLVFVYWSLEATANKENPKKN